MAIRWLLALILFLGVIVGGILFYQAFKIPAFSGSGRFNLKIHRETDLDEVIDSLANAGLQKERLFSILSKQMNYKSATLKSGLYEIDRSTPVVDLIRQLRSGKQRPVMVTINSVRTIPQLSGRITRNLELDSLTFLNFLRDSSQIHDTLMTRFIPNSYSIYWNIPPNYLLMRMDRERKLFFDRNDRRAKARAVGLTPTEVYILASIVEQESTLESEKPTIASVYLNRLNRGIKLQADPTIVFANMDFGIRRVLNKHLEIDSPYNTYKHEGLPPGPICMPSISSIDAVLDPADTDYIFFCAKPGYQNGHAFASTLRQHNNNANNYRQWLQSEGIR